MSTTVFDFAITGAGAAGLNLAMAMLEDPYFKDKRILILEKEEKNVNDKTWCYWEKGEGKWDELLHKKWQNGIVHTGKKKIQLHLEDYTYKMLRSLDFYNYALQKLKSSSIFYWVKTEVLEIQNQADKAVIKTSDENYLAKHVFDSRMEANLDEVSKSNTVLQHFRGWFIETEKAIFEPNSFMMMDFRLTWQNTTSFTYILPFTERSALVEFTFFSPDLVEDTVYNSMIQEYIEKIIQPENFKILKEEDGIIPMSDYQFHRANKSQITRIGTAGGWVKPSSGYSFKNAEYFSKRIIDNIKQGKNPAKELFSIKHRYYDSLFLNILKNRNHLGPELFSRMYRNNSASEIFRFLDEKTTLAEDLKIMAGFPPLLFMNAMWKNFMAKKL
ncbi:lycopene cyclase family protein [Gramella sp. GC03-9]|uniref:Lycopene cyclase family protein n=1 Tax=Christiangramia oceanisediminis TaxID=2920386 RepID=A0A9X2I8F2_9FLAO|nr:lycopene cyclase family protein [Gramella oceanisediminis]MCP9198578.1 lycopene cyclase family protein [Gramella oceanisediminis]